MLKTIISEKRPNLSKTSINTYTSTLSNLYKKIWTNDEFDVHKFDETEKVLDYLKDLPVNKRKSILSALVVLSEKKDYRDQMLEDIKAYNVETSKQKKTETQKTHWVTNQEIKDKFSEIRKNAMLKMRLKNISMTDKQEIQDYIILALMAGIYIPPRRLKDYVDFKIRNVNPDNNYNYRAGSKLHFKSYKTAKTYGEQIIPIPPVLVRLLRRWSDDINDSEFLLIDNNNKPLTNVKLNQRINRIFDKKVSCNQFRHTYLTEKYGDMIDKKKELKEDFKMMGSSIAQELVYIKEDD